MSDHAVTYGSTGQHHPYHIVRPSIWPLMGSLGAGLLALGLVLFMHKADVMGVNVGLKGVALGLFAVLAVMFFWWKDVIYESVVERVHSSEAQTGLRLGMGLFIASEVMFFVAFFWAFFDASIFISDVREVLALETTGGVWPPLKEGHPMHVIDPFDLPFLMTMILLLSGCTVTWAHHAILEGHGKQMSKALLYTVLLGVFFLFFQVYEYMHAPFSFKDNIYTSTFFMATGFHGFHVFVGTVFLLVCYLRSLKGHFTSDRHFGFEAAAWYWHFVDVVWLFLFIGIYWWGNTGGVFAAH
jgi:cytochrome c oxidase subunit 3